MNLKTKKKIAPYLYVMPVLILLLIMYGYPLIKSIIMSLQDYKLTSSGSAPFNDFANFKKMFSDTDFLLLLKISLIYVIISVVAQFASKQNSEDVESTSQLCFCHGLFLLL